MAVSIKIKKKKRAPSEMSAVFVVEPECSTCGQSELDANPPHMRLGCIKATTKTRCVKGTETERTSGQEQPAMTQSERSSSPLCKGRVSLLETEGRTLILQRHQASAETCGAAAREEAARRLSIGGLSHMH